MMMNKTVVAVAMAAGIAGLSSCGGPAYVNHANATYCVDHSGHVVDPSYCNPGPSYNPGIYEFWVGYTYGHMYHPGTVINHNYFVSGRQVNPASQSARKAAGIPASGSVRNGAKSTTTSKTPSSPAKPQNSPKAPTGVSGTKSGSTAPKSSTSSGSRTTTTTPRTSSSFGSKSGGSSYGGGSSSRSSSSFGGRK